jgi:hypothetical protein
MPAPLISPRLTTRKSAVGALLVALVGATLSLTPGPLAAERGKWTPLGVNYDQLLEMGGIAIHMALVPGTGADHSQIVWWGAPTSFIVGKRGGVLGWQYNAANDACGNPAGAGLVVRRTWDLGDPQPGDPSADLFCSGQVTLEGGAVLTLGGTDVNYGKTGIRNTFTYTAATGAWAANDPMSENRWYPTGTALRDSRVLVASGYKSRHIHFFSGWRNGQALEDSVRRFGVTTGGKWDPSVIPDPHDSFGQERPAPRQGGTMAYISDPSINGHVLFGGRNASGNDLPVDPFVWRFIRAQGSEFDQQQRYQWVKEGTGSDKPAPRSEHVALAISASEMLVFGGTTTAGEEFWRFFKDLQTGTWEWEKVQGVSGTAPTARFGCAAVYDAAGNGSNGRIILFGGATNFGGTPTDGDVYAFNLTSPGTAAGGGTWAKLDLSASASIPVPRRDHTMVLSLDPLDPNNRRAIWTYGGRLNSGGSDATLWKLRVGSSTVSDRWEPVPTSGTGPGPRADHSGVYSQSFQRLVFFGGVHPVTGVASDRKVYTIPIWVEPKAWTEWGESPVHLTGHATADEPGSVEDVLSRLPEIFDPGASPGQRWRVEPEASRLQESYPLHFLVPGTSIPGGGGRVLAAGRELETYYLDIPRRETAIAFGQGWRPFPPGAPTPINSGIPSRPGTGVTYAPGKILLAGGACCPDASAKSLDVADPNPVWRNQSGMLPRRFHHLVLVPTGEVLVVGGMHTVQNGDVLDADPGHAEFRPQLWSPATGSWTAANDLAADAAVRNYHSVALLLPDARVLTAGGWGEYPTGTPNPTRTKARIFCPPYLFKSDGLTPAPRPQITDAPAQVAWGRTFTVCVAETAGIRRVCLIRPGATTHGFDQNQRYVPLKIEGHAGNPQRIFVTAPASPDSAPPGDYLLFLTGAMDGATHYPDVPSVARWLQLRTADGSDLCDVAPPATLELAPDVVGPTSVFLTWSATADDGVLPASGPARRFDLRKSLFPIDSDPSWSFAGPVPGVPVPGPVGTAHSLDVTDLFPCTNYYFSLRAEDDRPNLAALPPHLQVQTMCGGGGGGFSAAHVGGDPEGGGGMLAAGASSSPSGTEQPAGEPARGSTLFGAGGLLPEASTLVVATDRSENGGWRVALRLVPAEPGARPAGNGVIVEREDESGARETLGRYEPDEADHLLGICALRERGRIGIPGVYGLEQVLPRFRSRAGSFTLAEAWHSRLGPLGSAFVTSGGAFEFSAGDSLVLTYAPAPGPEDDARAWYLLVRRIGSEPPIPMSRRGESAEAVPQRFALHKSEPNPARTSTVIRFELPGDSPVKLEVFDLLGRRVATLADAGFPAGAHAVTWDVRDANGMQVRPGVYSYRLTAGGFRAWRKLGVLP